MEILLMLLFKFQVLMYLSSVLRGYRAVMENCLYGGSGSEIAMRYCWRWQRVLLFFAGFVSIYLTSRLILSIAVRFFAIFFVSARPNLSPLLK